MLLNDFFFIQRVEKGEKSLNAFLLINKSHKIFEGHFPAVPIVPGVCMMQMIKEIIEQHVDRKLIVSNGDNMKFLNVINPTQHSEIEAAITYDDAQEGIKVMASLRSGDITFFKLKATLQSV